MKILCFQIFLFLKFIFFVFLLVFDFLAFGFWDRFIEFILSSNCSSNLYNLWPLNHLTKFIIYFYNLLKGGFTFNI
jgi:hypothetical protein